MEGRAMSSMFVKCLSEKFCLSLSLLHALICHFCLCVPEEHLLLTRKLSSLYALCFLSRALKQLNLLKMLSCLFRNRVGPFFFLWGTGWGQTSLQLSQPRMAFFFPCCTYSIFPLLVPSRQEHSVVTWREGGRETWCKIHLCTSVSES